MKVAPCVWWTVERDGILLLDRSRGTARKLGYPQAAVWDLLSRGEPFDRLVKKLAAIAGCDPDGAERIARDAIRAWLDAGLLESRRRKGTDRG